MPTMPLEMWSAARAALLPQPWAERSLAPRAAECALRASRSVLRLALPLSPPGERLSRKAAAVRGVQDGQGDPQRVTPMRLAKTLLPAVRVPLRLVARLLLQQGLQPVLQHLAVRQLSPKREPLLPVLPLRLRAFCSRQASPSLMAIHRRPRPLPLAARPPLRRATWSCTRPCLSSSLPRVQPCSGRH